MADRAGRPTTHHVRRAWCCAAVLIALVLASCAVPTPQDAPPSVSDTATVVESSPSPSPVVSRSPTCASLAASMPLAARISELFMVGLSSQATPAQAVEVVRASQAGSVVLLGNSHDGVAKTAVLVAAIRSVAPLAIVAADQEGGSVQRLQGPGFDTIPSAQSQARMGEGLTSAATTWGRQLAAAGVLYDLAPVADVVPASMASSNKAIGVPRRGYGSDQTAASQPVAAFVAGMRAAGVATAVKHFPGIGNVTENPDDGPATDTVTTRTSSVATFRAGIGAGASSVMVASVMYTRIDAGVPGVFSAVVIDGMLRGDLGFDGVVISDDLGAAKAVASVAPGDRAVRFLRAGGDLVINADPAKQPAMTQAVSRLATTDQDFAARVTQSAARVLRVKASVGLVTCR